MEIFNGKKLAQEILDGLKNETAPWPEKPSLAVVSFGDGRINSSYITQKSKTAGFLDFGFKHYRYSESNFSRAREFLNKIAKSEKNSAIVVQLPLPDELSPSILNVIPVTKDPDLLSDRAVGMFFNNRSLVGPPTPTAILKILNVSNTELKNKNVVVFGYGRLIGRFLVSLLIKEGAVVSVVEKNHPREVILAVSLKADIIISAAGDPQFLTGDMIKKGAVVVDAGFSFGTGSTLIDKGGISGRITGDVNLESVKSKVSLVTPVPGGVGPVSVALLFENIKRLFEKFYNQRKTN